MKKIIKISVGKILVSMLIFLTITGWFFSGWPQIWQKPSLPPQVPEAQAQTTIFYETFPNADGAWNGSGDTAQDTPNWVTYQGVGDTNDVQVSSAAIGSSPSGGNHLTFEDCDEGFQTPEVYDIAYVPIDLSSWTDVVIEYYWQSDDVDIGEGLRVAYSTSSTDGRNGTWTQIAEYLDPTDDVWTKETFNLPNEAAVANFKLRFSSMSNAISEHMYVDDIKLTGTPLPAVITVDTTDNQTASMAIPSYNNYLGGAFTFIRDLGTANVTQIVISETGTVNANANLSNINLYYETAAVCSYEGAETLFGNAAGFDVSEKATISGTMPVGTSQVCIYLVLDVSPGALEDQTLEIEISDPSTEVTISTGAVIPATPVAIAGTTSLIAPIFYETFPNADGAWNGSGDTAQDTPGWVTYQGAGDIDDVQVSNEDVGSSPSGGNHLTFEDCDEGFQTPEVYDIAYVPIDLSSWTDVVIEYYWQSDDVGAGEGLRVAYSTDSTDGRDGTWTQIAEYLNPTDDVWTKETFNLPNEAAVANFKLRFSSMSNAISEHMYVDDIKLTRTVPAAWKAPENTPITDVNKNENIRLRFQITNIGSEATDYDYLLEYASRVGAICGDNESFIAVPVTASTEHFEMTASIYFTDGDSTSARLTLPDSYAFVAGKMVEDPSNSSGNITLPLENYTEIEFVFQANDNAVNGESYCLRLTKAGSLLDDYYIYPELQIAY